MCTIAWMHACSSVGYQSFKCKSIYIPYPCKLIFVIVWTKSHQISWVPHKIVSGLFLLLKVGYFFFFKYCFILFFYKVACFVSLIILSWLRVRRNPYPNRFKDRIPLPVLHSNDHRKTGTLNRFKESLSLKLPLLFFMGKLITEYAYHLQNLVESQALTLTLLVYFSLVQNRSLKYTNIMDASNVFVLWNPVYGWNIV